MGSEKNGMLNSVKGHLGNPVVWAVIVGVTPVLQIGAAVSAFHSAIFVAVVGAYIVLSVSERKPVFRPGLIRVTIVGMALPIVSGIMIGHAAHYATEDFEKTRQKVEANADLISREFSVFADAFRNGKVEVLEMAGHSRYRLVANDIVAKWLMKATAQVFYPNSNADNSTASLDWFLADRVFFLSSVEAREDRLRDWSVVDFGPWHDKLSVESVREYLDGMVRSSVSVDIVMCAFNRAGDITEISAVPSGMSIDARSLEGSAPLVDICRSVSDPEALPEGTAFKEIPMDNVSIFSSLLE